MKNKALTYVGIALGLAAAIWALSEVVINLGVVASFGWATAGVLLAMAPLTYRSGKNLAV